MAALAPHTTGLIARPLESPNEGNLPGFLNIAQRVDLELSPPQLHATVTAKHRLSLSTRANAAAYLEEVRMKARGSISCSERHVTKSDVEGVNVNE